MDLMRIQLILDMVRLLQALEEIAQNMLPHIIVVEVVLLVLDKTINMEMLLMKQEAGIQTALTLCTLVARSSLVEASIALRRLMQVCSTITTSRATTSAAAVFAFPSQCNLSSDI